MKKIAILSCLNSNKVIFQVTPGMKYRAFVTLMKMMGTEKAVNLLSLISNLISIFLEKPLKTPSECRHGQPEILFS